MDMEAQLAEYRARKRKEAAVNAAKANLFDYTLPDTIPTTNMTTKAEDNLSLLENSLDDDSVQSLDHGTQDESPYFRTTSSRTVFVLKLALYLALWITLFFIFIEMQFGAVFLVISMLIGIYINTRTRPKLKGEISAYSVFNENCQSIDGTLDAEQFEREIRYGPGSV